MKKPKLHLICNAHLDPVWQWQWEEGAAEAISTFGNAVDILNEHDKLVFNHNEAVLYEWIKKYDPTLFKEIQNLVAENRWHISGGWYLQPDVNLPGTEAIIRQITAGRKFFKENFNVEPKTAYNFDSFGHSGGLPQILNKAGYKMYIHMRPQQHDLNIPSDLYRWRGVDGSEIDVVRIAIGLYHTEYDNIKQRINEGIELAIKLKRDVPVFWGIGDHGGGATRKDLRIIDEIILQEDRVEIIHSTTDLLYESLKDEFKNAPVVNGDLQRVFTGCYTSLSRIKRGMQKSLGLITQTETLSAAARWMLDHDYPAEKLNKIWEDHLLNDFHDILPGTCIEPAEKDALNLYGKIEEEVRRIRLGIATAFNKREKEKSYIPVTVLNSNPHQTRVAIEVECMISHRPKWTGKWHLKLFDENGKEIICQEEQPNALLPFYDWRRKISFIAELPSIGKKNYNIQAAEGELEKIQCKTKVNYKIDESTGLINSFKTNNDIECLTGNLFTPLVIEDTADSWGTDHWSYRKVLDEFQFRKGSLKVIEEGPVRKITESILTYNNSKLVIQTIAYSGLDLIEFKMRLHWNEERKRLKLSVPTTFYVNNLLCEVPGGIIERPADGEEHVHQRWFILKDKKEGEEKAFAVINNGQNGIDFKDGEVRLSVLRSPAYCHEQGMKLDEHPYRKFSDIGIHELRFFVIAGEAGDILNRVSSLADLISSPLAVYSHLPAGLFNIKETKEELLKISELNIRLLAMKQSWDGKAIILRLQETIKQSTNVDIKFDEKNINLQFNPLEIKTIRIERDRTSKEVDMIWEI